MESTNREECFEPLKAVTANDIAAWRGPFNFQTSTDSIVESETAAVSEDPQAAIRILH
jgi:hypothetical protein